MKLVLFSHARKLLKHTDEVVCGGRGGEGGERRGGEERVGRGKEAS